MRVKSLVSTPVQRLSLPLGRRRVARVLGLVLLLGAAPVLAGPGEKMLKEFQEQGQIYDDPAWADYVQKLGERLVAVSPAKGSEFHFNIVDISSVNAFALPDGYIFVHRGLLVFLESEDQLAAVLGHEIGHVVGNHARGRTAIGALGSIAGFVGAVLTGQGAMMDVANSATALLVSGYGREQELEADRLGGEYLVKAGYDPYAMIDVVQVLKDHELFEKETAGGQQTYHGLFASHPKNDKRLHDAVLHAYETGLGGDVTGEPIADYWALIDGLVYGDEAAGGLVKDRTFYHSGMRFVVEFPEKWIVSNGTKGVSARAPGGSAEGSIQLERLESVKGQSPKEYVEETLKRDDLERGEEIEVNSYKGYLAEVDVSGGKAKAAFIAVVFKDKGVFYFKGEAGEKGDPQTFAAAFRATVASFRAMQATDLKDANKQRVRVVEAQPGDSYRTLAQRSSLRNEAEGTLRLINGDYPVREPRPGDLIKIVQ